MRLSTRVLLPWTISAFCLAGWVRGFAQESPADAKEEQEQQEGSHSRFLRIVRDRQKVPIRLEAAIVRHVPQDCSRDWPTVDLIGAVHVAEKSYYEELNRQFEKYDVVLYELVAPEGTRVPKGGPTSTSGNPVSMLQTGMTGLLNLEFQLKGIDYTKSNLVHADLSPDEFARTMQKRGESTLQVFLRMMGYAMARQGGKEGGPSDGQLLLALLNKNRALALKRVMAEEFEDMDGQLTAISGPDGSTLITERNKRALEVLAKQIDAGKKRIGIFYGAGHMADMQKRLKDEFGLTPISTRWLPAWNMASPAKPAEKKQAGPG